MFAYLPPPEVPGKLSSAVTQANIQQTICVPGYTAKVRPPEAYTYRIKVQLAHNMGVKLSLYELDHRVPLGLGGDPISPQNLWMEPWSGPWNATLKDKLEVALMRQVCSGRTTLAAAQKAFLGDWTVAYRIVYG